jgi:thiamine-phosphate pyrophosphorylase
LSKLADRCRLVLIASPAGANPASIDAVTKAMSGGDIASVLLAQFDASEDTFRDWCEKAVPIVQAANAAAVVVDDTQGAGRAKADGIHISGDVTALAEAVSKFQHRMIIGAGVANSRHDAMELGEEQPDYLFVGRLDGDNQPAPNPRSLELAEWWSSMIEIPCISMGGSSVECVIEVAQAGPEFVALCAAIFGKGLDPAAQVALANKLLDEHAPELVEAKHEK